MLQKPAWEAPKLIFSPPAACWNYQPKGSRILPLTLYKGTDWTTAFTLFFESPLGLGTSCPVWEGHAQTQGQHWRNFGKGQVVKGSPMWTQVLVLLGVHWTEGDWVVFHEMIQSTKVLSWISKYLIWSSTEFFDFLAIKTWLNHSFSPSKNNIYAQIVWQFKYL